MSRMWVTTGSRVTISLAVGGVTIYRQTDTTLIDSIASSSATHRGAIFYSAPLPAVTVAD